MEPVVTMVPSRYQGRTAASVLKMEEILSCPLGLTTADERAMAFVEQST